MTVSWSSAAHKWLWVIWGDGDNHAFFVDKNTGVRTYRTGDLCHCDAQGLWYFDGRKDDQVKIRGVRIAPQEIALAFAPLIDAAQVKIVADNGVLKAYYTGRCRNRSQSRTTD